MAEKEPMTAMAVTVTEFLMSRRGAALRSGTLQFYRNRLMLLLKFCDEQGLADIQQLNPSSVVRYLVWLEETNHSQGGRHAAWRALRAFVNWYIFAYEPDEKWNPLAKVKAPKRPKDKLPPVPVGDIRAMIDACPGDNLVGLRDKAILRMLADTGLRAAELLALDYKDIDLIRGTAHVLHGKGDKARTVMFGAKTKRAIRAYLKQRKEDPGPLWQTARHERMTYWALKDMMEDRARQAGVKRPAIHGFRRTFASECNRSGMNVFTLQGLMGHADTRTTLGYVTSTDDDTWAEFQRASPGDKI